MASPDAAQTVVAAAFFSASVLVFRKPPTGKGTILIVGTHSPLFASPPLLVGPREKEKHGKGDNIQG